MKIPLKIRKRFDTPMAFAFISIRTPKYHIRPMPIWTLIDTGSPWTSITPYDAMMLKIPLSVLKPNRKYPYVLFASHKFERLSLTHITLRLKNDAGEIVIDGQKINSVD